ncbi:MAG: hypothetical protein Q8P24_00020 [Desulfobacterales bacterium]|nr:hypothetical protein [Desulfobacterales bacterium]
MRSRQNRHLYIFLSMGFALIFLAGARTARAASVQVSVRNFLISIQARQAPVIDVLKAIADRTGISFETGDPLAEPVSLDFKDLTLEECIRRLLVNRNFSLIFEKSTTNVVVLKSVRVTGSGPMTRVQPGPGLPQPRPEAPSQEHVVHRSYKKDWLVKEFENAQRLEAQIRIADPDDGISDGGARVRRISRRSVLSQIGLKKDDVVHSVNGTPVQSAGELIEALQSASREGGSIHIERKLRDGRMEPIQIEIQ